MTIRRQYSLPNCTLVLEGLSTKHSTQAERPLLDVLIRFECHLTGALKPLTGGRDLLENLAAAASQFAQEFLSGVQHSNRDSLNGRSPLVRLEPVETRACRLIVQPELLIQAPVAESSAAPSTAQPALPIETTLSTVQVFDLVEAFDQFFADTQTLPDLSLNFKPLSRRVSTSRQPVTERAAPAALGVASLVLASVAFFFIPIPEVEKPRTPTPEDSPPQRERDQPPGPQGAPEPRQSSAGAAAAASGIANPDQEVLKQKLYTQIDQAWKADPTFDQDLIYRVSVDQSGKIAGYQFQNQAAVDYGSEVPLLDLLGVPPDSSTQKPLAQFQVVFTPSRVLQVRPWIDGRVSFGS